MAPTPCLLPTLGSVLLTFLAPCPVGDRETPTGQYHLLCVAKRVGARGGCHALERVRHANLPCWRTRQGRSSRDPTTSCGMNRRRVRQLATCRPGPQRSAAGGTVGDSPEPKTILTCRPSRKPPPAHPVRAPVAPWQRRTAATGRLARPRMRLGHGGVEPMLAGSSPGRDSVWPSLSRAFYARRFGTQAAIGRGGGRSGCLPHGRWLTGSVCRKSCVPRGRQDR